MDQPPKIYLYRRIVLAKLFIDEHYAEDIDLDAIAGEASFSKFHFIRLFKMAYGKTPHQYLTRVRIEQAKLLLEKGESVSDVCFAVGFDGVSSFTHLFKRFTKMTPSAYLRQQQQRIEEIAAAPLKFIPGCFAAQNGWI
jgi:AraC-type DNA-binding domain-containing proteins